MGPDRHPLGSPVAFARAIETACREGMDGASLHALHAHEAWEERSWVWTRMMRALRIDGFPIRVAKASSTTDLGALGMAARCAPDLGTAFGRLLLHQGRFTGRAFGRIRLDASHDSIVFELMPVEGLDLGARCRREMMLANGLQIARDVSGRWLEPRRVCFAHRAPGNTREHRTFFGCEVEFEADFDGIEFDLDTLERPLPGADTGLSRFWEEHLRSLVDGSAGSELEARVEQTIRARLGSKSLAMDDVARELGMSSRTLRRRLADRRRPYHAILDRVRRERADALLRDPAHTLAEVADRLGFSEASAFHRAYTRWTGRTPASRRPGEESAI